MLVKIMGNGYCRAIDDDNGEIKYEVTIKKKCEKTLCMKRQTCPLFSSVATLKS